MTSLQQEGATLNGYIFGIGAILEGTEHSFSGPSALRVRPRSNGYQEGWAPANPPDSFWSPFHGTEAGRKVWGARGSLRASVSGQWQWAVRKEGALHLGLWGRVKSRASAQGEGRP